MTDKMTTTASTPMFRFFVERGGAIGERVLDGALRWAEEHSADCIVDTDTPSNTRALSDPDCMGVAGMFSDPKRRMDLRKLSYPVLNFSNRHGPVEGLGNLLSDDVAAGRMAGEYLLAKGYRHFLGVSQHGVTYGKERLGGFRSAVRAGNCDARLLYFDFDKDRENPSTRVYVEGLMARLGPYLENMPFDSAVFCTNDWVAGLVQRALAEHHPERLHTTAVMGVDDEQQAYWYLGPLAGLSSVRPSFHAIGAEALRFLLEHPGDRKACAGLLRRFPPERVVERASTAGGVCADPLTARMMRWVWMEMSTGRRVLVSDIAVRHNMSRRSVERRFADYAGVSAGDYLQKLRLDLARHLLRVGNLPISEISERCGFAKQDIFSTSFRRVFGITPRAYRSGTEPLSLPPSG